MALKTNGKHDLSSVLLNKKVPLAHRQRLLQAMVENDSDESQEVIGALLARAEESNGASAYAERLAKVNAVLEELERGPLRGAMFEQLLVGDTRPAGNAHEDHADGNQAAAPPPRARVLLDDGTAAYTTVVDEQLAASLRAGDAVLLDAEGRTLIAVDHHRTATGEIAEFERRISASTVEVVLRGGERAVYRAAGCLEAKLDQGDATAGNRLLVCPRRRVAFDVVPNDGQLSRYRYLVEQPVPDVVIDRDIGDPPSFLEELAEHVHIEMTRPELGRKYRRLRSRFTLLEGVSGSGKSLCILGLWRRIYEVMSQVTGVPIDRLPARVLRLRASSVLSKWYGESEKQLDRFFDEVESVASQPFIGPDGTAHELPTLVICEEIDGLARARGGDSIHDRIQTTLLQRLDVTSQQLRNQLILFAFTTNVPELVDPAFLRRASGTTVRFGRLSAAACRDVLDKHLRDLPFEPEGNERPNKSRRRVKSQFLPWLFDAGRPTRGVVELTFVGATEPVTKHRRDFVTGAIVARAVQQAADKACRSEASGQRPAGIRTDHLIRAFDQQIRNVVDRLHPQNVGHYVTLPDGARVASVRRIPQPAVQPNELERR